MSDYSTVSSTWVGAGWTRGPCADWYRNREVRVEVKETPHTRMANQVTMGWLD